jgi:hypothetical protein
MKTEVYSWRLSIELKAGLEEQARSEGKSVSALLEELASDGLHARRNGQSDDEARQAAIRKRVTASVGTIQGNDPHRSEQAARLVREVIHRKHRKESDALARRSRRRTD